jgi:hypothetical protein
MYRALVVALLLTAGCDGAIRDPVGLGGGGSGGTGGSGGGSGNGSGVLLGDWQAVFIFELDFDIQRHTTTWQFMGDDICRRTVEVYSVLEDRTLTTSVNCTFRASGSDVAITFEARSTPVTFRWSLVNFSRDQLLLDGIPYDRLP